MCDACFEIIHYDGKVEKRFVDAFCNDEIIQVSSVEFDFSSNEIVELHFLDRVLEADHRVAISLLLHFFF